MATVNSRRAGTKSSKKANKETATTVADAAGKAGQSKRVAKKPAASKQSRAKPKTVAVKSKAGATAKATTKVAAKTAKKPAAKETATRTNKPSGKAPVKAKAKAKTTESVKQSAVAQQSQSAKTAPKTSAKKTKSRKAAAPKTAAAPVKTTKKRKLPVLPRDFLFDLARAIRDAVAPHARAGKGREIVSKSRSGDATFQLDRYAEKALLAFLKEKNLPIAYYSEDSGYTTFNNETPQHLLIVDPIDGSRAAKSGFEGCVVALASTRVMERPTFKDLDNACVLEIIGDRAFYAERGKGVRMWQGEQVKKPKLSPNDDIETLTWAMTVPARPAELIFPTAGKLIDISSLKGGFFACNSTSYSLTRLLTGQLDAYVDFANRYFRDIPNIVRDLFINAGRGEILGIVPYDMAAALMIAEEAGCVVTDAYGKRFDDVMLLDSTVDNQQTIIAAGNARMHRALLRFFDKRIKQFEQLYLHRNHK